LFKGDVGHFPENLGSQAIYRKKKIYLPDEIAKKLHLKDWDRVEFMVKERITVSLKITKKAQQKTFC
jgi:bifunctional DNA-binding transcriptional regulator/antitoxin component of YhaV-PrlF toxin-antitoxin module